MSFIFPNPKDQQENISRKFRELRVLKNFKRKTLAEKACVSEASLKRFEVTGEISLRSLLRLAHVLDALDHFDTVFDPPPPESLSEIVRREERLEKRTQVKKRGRL